MLRLVFLISAVLIACSDCRHRRLNTADNEVIKPEVFLPHVADDFLEAYYYRMMPESQDVGMLIPRQGNASSTSSCSSVREVPDDLRLSVKIRPNGISRYYTKYTEAYGIPVIAANSVPDRSLSRACYVLRFLLADRADVRNAYFKRHGRVAVIPYDQHISSLPEYRFLSTRFDVATRGLGATTFARVSSAGQENIMCFDDDDYGNEDILLKEMALGIYHLAAKNIEPGMDQRLEEIYNRAMEGGLWSNTYSEHSADAYLGEGVQTFFNGNAYGSPPDGRHNDINTRTKLREYNYDLYEFITTLFPCMNNFLKRCNSRGNEAFQRLRMNCPRRHWRSRLIRRY